MLKSRPYAIAAYNNIAFYHRNSDSSHLCCWYFIHVVFKSSTSPRCVFIVGTYKSAGFVGNFTRKLGRHILHIMWIYIVLEMAYSI